MCGLPYGVDGWRLRLTNCDAMRYAQVRATQSSGQSSRIFNVVTGARAYNFRTLDDEMMEKWAGVLRDIAVGLGAPREETLLPRSRSQYDVPFEESDDSEGEESARLSVSSPQASGASGAAVPTPPAKPSPPSARELVERDVGASVDEGARGASGSNASAASMPHGRPNQASDASDVTNRDPSDSMGSLSSKDVAAAAAAIVGQLGSQLGVEQTTEQQLEVETLAQQLEGLKLDFGPPRSMLLAPPQAAKATGDVSTPRSASSVGSTKKASAGPGVGLLTRRIRTLVSLKKRRFVEDGFNLDLTYITPQIIAMGFPSEGAEGVFRNPMSEVAAFLEKRHKDHYMVYNLCSERSYDPTKLNNRVQLFPFDDHNPPPLRMIPALCASVKEFLDEHEENVVVIHCKAGKGRTGTMICAYMLFCGEFDRAQTSLGWYGFVRTQDSKGVTIPSQRRYVEYMETLVKQKLLDPETNFKVPPSVCYLQCVRFHSLPTFDASVKGSSDPWIEVTQGGDVLLSARYRTDSMPSFASYDAEQPKGGDGTRRPSSDPPARQVSGLVGNGASRDAPWFECNLLELRGDFKVTVYDAEPGKNQKMLSFWMHSLCIPQAESGEASASSVVRLIKPELDGAASDKKHKQFPADFFVDAMFTFELPAAVAKQRAKEQEKGQGQADSADSGRLDGDDDDDDDDDDEYEAAAPRLLTKAKQGASSFLLGATVGLRPLRHLVSKNKRRYKSDGFDLDLTYITPQVIAMGFPSEGTERVFRNPMSEVAAFLEKRHKDHYMVYNLCSERSYDATKFNRRVQLFPFDDHNPPPLRMIGDFCTSVKEFLDEHPSNVVAIHCKAGKGRTGVMISAFLLHNRFFVEADDALAFYGFARTNDCEGVTIPSQRTYVHYHEAICKNPSLRARLTDKALTRTLKSVRLVTLPNAVSKDKCDLCVRIRPRVGDSNWTSRKPVLSDVR